jgi:chemotaxis protein histidine kinase CheA
VAAAVSANAVAPPVAAVRKSFVPPVYSTLYFSKPTFTDNDLVLLFPSLAGASVQIPVVPAPAAWLGPPAAPVEKGDRGGGGGGGGGGGDRAEESQGRSGASKKAAQPAPRKPNVLPAASAVAAASPAVASEEKKPAKSGKAKKSKQLAAAAAAAAAALPAPAPSAAEVEAARVAAEERARRAAAKAAEAAAVAEVLRELEEEYAAEYLDEVVEGLTETLVRRAHQQLLKDAKLQVEQEHERRRKERETELQQERARLAEARRVRKQAVTAESGRWAEAVLEEVLHEELAAAVVQVLGAKQLEQEADEAAEAAQLAAAAAAAAKYHPPSPGRMTAPVVPVAVTASPTAMPVGGSGPVSYAFTPAVAPAVTPAGLIPMGAPPFAPQLAAAGSGGGGYFDYGMLAGATSSAAAAAAAKGGVFSPGVFGGQNVMLVRQQQPPLQPQPIYTAASTMATAGSSPSSAGPAKEELSALLFKAMPAARMIKTVPEEVGLTSRASVEVHNLPRGVSEEEVEGLFPGLDVEQVVLLRGPDLGCALVEFADGDAADAAERSSSSRRYALRGAPVLVRKPRVAVLTSGSGQTFALAPGARTASAGPAAAVAIKEAAVATAKQHKDVPDYSTPVSALSYLLQADDDMPDLSHFAASDLSFGPSASPGASSAPGSLFASSLFASPFLASPSDSVPPPPGFDAPPGLSSPPGAGAIGAGVGAGAGAAAAFGGGVGNLFPSVGGGLWGGFQDK